MTIEEKVNRIIYLVETLIKWTDAYDLGHPVVSDKEWDDYYFELEQLEKETGLIYPDSPTQSIHFQNLSHLDKVTHNHPMLSLAKTKDGNEVLKFIENKDAIVMAKMDGLTLSLHYIDGRLDGAETRGNGVTGENVIHNTRAVPSIPRHIDYKGELIVDGEIISTYENFEAFSQYYANPRNFASGSIRLLDAKECNKRGLTFVAWDIIKGSEKTTLSDKLVELRDYGFITVPYASLPKAETRNFDKIVEPLKNMCADLSYPIDGLVFKYDNCAEYDSMGATDHHFKGGLAYKFYDEEYDTKLIEIQWSVGRTGQLCPVAVFEPIDTGESIIERASLHNITVMYDTLHTPYRAQHLKVAKMNMIIPQVVWADEDVRPQDYVFQVPERCTICGAPTIRKKDNDSEVLYCTNKKCSSRIINRLVHYCSNQGLNIKGLSHETIKKLHEIGVLNCYGDIYRLKEHRDEWIELPGFGPKSVDQVIQNIEDSKNTTLDKFLCAIGIPLIGAVAAKELVKHVESYEDLREKVDLLYDFGIYEFFADCKRKCLWYFNYEDADDAYQYLNVENHMAKIEVTGDVFVITGTLKHFKNRAELIKTIEGFGGRVASTISGKTTYLINNDINSTTGKNNDAKRMGVPIISEEEFIDLYLTK